MTTMPPRSRPGKTYPGGKKLRKAHARLSLRINGEQDGKRPDRITSREGTAPWGNHGFTKPGSMKA